MSNHHRNTIYIMANKVIYITHMSSLYYYYYYSSLLQISLLSLLSIL